METNYKGNCTKSNWKVDERSPAIVVAGQIDITQTYTQEEENILSHDEIMSLGNANALLIAEAGTVLNETGFTPRELANQNRELLEALLAITSNEHIDLGDLIYKVKDRELQGWEGAQVKQWSDAVQKVNTAIQNATTK